MKRLYDFQDFVDCVAKRGSAVFMNRDDFIDDSNEKGSGKDVRCPILSLSLFIVTILQKVSEVQLRKGSTKLYWKQDFDDLQYKQIEFLKKKT